MLYSSRASTDGHLVDDGTHTPSLAGARDAKTDTFSFRAILGCAFDVTWRDFIHWIQALICTHVDGIL